MLGYISTNIFTCLSQIPLILISFKDEILAEDEKVVLRVRDLVRLVATGPVRWTKGLLAIGRGPSNIKSNSEQLGTVDNNQLNQCRSNCKGSKLLHSTVVSSLVIFTRLFRYLVISCHFFVIFDIVSFSFSCQILWNVGLLLDFDSQLFIWIFWLEIPYISYCLLLQIFIIIIIKLSFPADIGTKPASPAHRSRWRIHAG